MANKESETSLVTPSSSPAPERLPYPSPSAQALERVRAELRRRYKKRRISTPNALENENSGTELTSQSNVTSGKDVSNTRSMGNDDENQEQGVAPDGEENVGDERKDSSEDQIHTFKRCKRRQNSSLNKGLNNSLDRASSSSERVGERGESQPGNGENEERKGGAVERKDLAAGSEDGPLPNKYREEYRMCYIQLNKQRRAHVPEVPVRQGRTKRTLTGRRPRRVVPTINDSIWRVQYEIGCLPGGSNEFLAPKREDYDVCESLERAGYVGIGILAKKLGYHVKEMQSLGGYGIEVDTDDRVELSWCPPDSEYSRIILTKLPSTSGLWVVDVECGFEHNETRPFEIPSWRTVGPFRSIEDAVAEAKKQVGANRGWGWERVALDGAFEIKMDNASGWEGHWNPEGCEYSRVVVKMIGWPEARFEHTCNCKYTHWRRAFGLERCNGSKGEAVRVEWHET